MRNTTLKNRVTRLEVGNADPSQADSEKRKIERILAGLGQTNLFDQRQHGDYTTAYQGDP